MSQDTLFGTCAHVMHLGVTTWECVLSQGHVNDRHYMVPVSSEAAGGDW